MATDKSHKAVDVHTTNPTAKGLTERLDANSPEAIKRAKALAQARPLDSAAAKEERKFKHKFKPPIMAGENTLRTRITRKLDAAKNSNEFELDNAEMRYCLEHPAYVRSVDHPVAALDLNEELMRHPTFAANITYMHQEIVRRLVPEGLANQDLINEASSMANEMARFYLQQLYGITNVDNVITAGVYAPVQASGHQHASVPLQAAPLAPISNQINDQVDAIVAKLTEAQQLLKSLQQEAGVGYNEHAKLNDLLKAKRERSLARKATRQSQHEARVEQRQEQRQARRHERGLLAQTNKHEQEEKEDNAERAEDIMEWAQEYLTALSIRPKPGPKRPEPSGSGKNWPPVPKPE